MAELERVRMRERMLEQALAKLAGENWQVGSLPWCRWLKLDARVDGVGYCAVISDGRRSGNGVVIFESRAGDAAAAI